MTVFLRHFTPRVVYLAVPLFIFLLHASYLSNGFIWLDHGDIEHGRALWVVEQLPNALFSRFGDTGFYRPLVSATESIDARLYDDWAPGYHLTNVFLHVIAVALVPIFLSIFFSFTAFECILAMLLFGIHPFAWLPTGAISYRSEILVTIFVFLTVYLHSKARTSSKVENTSKSFFEFFTIVSFFLALLSKETAIFLIPAFILLWEVTRQGASLRAIGRGLIIFISEIIVVCFFLWLRFQAVPEVWRVPQLALSWQDALGTRLLVMDKLLLGFINPLKPGVSDAVQVIGLTNVFVLGFFVGLLGVIRIIAKTGIASMWSKAFLLLFITLLPAFSIIPMPRLGSPHYGYSALIGFCSLVILALRFFSKKHRIARRVVYSLCGLWFIVMCFSTFIGGFQFKNDLAFFAPELKRDPHFLEGYFYIGNYYLKDRQYKAAEDAYRSALKSSPGIIAYSEKQSTLINLAITQARMGKLDEADVLFIQAEKIASPKEKEYIRLNREIINRERKKVKK